MNLKVDKPFNLEAIRLKEANKMVARALTHFEDNPGICWTQLPMEQSIWETLQEAVEKQIYKKTTSKPWSGINGVPYKNCPSCDHLLWGGSVFDKKDNHCLNCGQKIDWD